MFFIYFYCQKRFSHSESFFSLLHILINVFFTSLTRMYNALSLCTFVLSSLTRKYNVLDIGNIHCHAISQQLDTYVQWEHSLSCYFETTWHVCTMPWTLCTFVFKSLKRKHNALNIGIIQMYMLLKSSLMYRKQFKISHRK